MQSQIKTLGLNQHLTIVLASMGIPWFLESNQFRDPLSFGILDELPCYVGQYASMRIKSHIYLFICLGVIILCLMVCTVIHNCSSSGSLFFATLRWNN